MSESARQRLDLGRVAGGSLLVSIFFWWTALQAWATAQYGYLDLDVTGVTPLLWVLLIALAGVTLLTGVLPRRGANVAAALLVILVVIALAVPNIAANVDDGISGAGWLVAGVSLAQVSVILLALFAPWTGAKVARGERDVIVKETKPSPPNAR